MKTVHTAGDEAEALMLQGLLQQVGIPVMLRSHQIPGYAEVVERATGVWGDLLVPDERAAEARALLAEYLASSRDSRPAPRERIAGVVVPTVTLLDQHGAIDEDANVRHLEWLIGRGVHGLFTLGTTGEFSSLAREERRLMAELTVRVARGRVPVLVGVSSPGTDEAIAYAEHAEAVGASGVVAVLPYYWIPSDRSIYEHYRLLSVSTALPVYIYNFPALTGRSIPPRLVARLAADRPNIVGIKDTVDSIGHLLETLALTRAVRPEFTVLCGMDYHLLNTVLIGGDGCVPGSANFAPDPFVRVWRSATAGNVAAAAEDARALAPIPGIYEMDAPAFVIVKEAMVMAGLIPHAASRAPAVPLSEDERRRLRRGLAAMGVVG